MQSGISSSIVSLGGSTSVTGSIEHACMSCLKGGENMGYTPSPANKDHDTKMKTTDDVSGKPYRPREVRA